MFAKISNNQIVQYPASPHSDFPYVSFPDDWQGGTIEGMTYSIVVSSDQPTANLGWGVVEAAPSYDANAGVATQQWTLALESPSDLSASITNYRYNVETGGVNINGTIFPTDRDSQGKYTGICLYASLPTTNLQTFSVTWKLANSTFTILNASQVMEIATTVMGHVQAAFAQEDYYLNLINTANSSTLQATDFTQGWPTNA